MSTSSPASQSRLARAAPSALLALLVPACVISDAPEGDSGFAPVGSLAELAGRYEERGEVEPGAAPHLLTGALARIGGPRLVAPHAPVDAIEIAVPDDGTLRARAFAGTEPVGEWQLAASPLGPDGPWSLHESRAWLHSGQPEDPLLGPQGRSCEVGLDCDGNLRWREEEWFAGCCGCIVPGAWRSERVVRHRRLAVQPSAAAGR